MTVMDIRTVALPLGVEVTRDMVGAVLDLTAAGGEDAIASWTPEFVRTAVEASVRYFGPESMAEDAEYFATAGDGSIMEYLAAVYAAVDRAYPELAVAA